MRAVSFRCYGGPHKLITGIHGPTQIATTFLIGAHPVLESNLVKSGKNRREIDVPLAQYFEFAVREILEVNIMYPLKKSGGQVY